MTMGTVELMERGMRCLAENLGDVEAERFIAAIMRERFDYTRWRQRLFAGMSPREFNEAAAAFAKTIENE